MKPSIYSLTRQEMIEWAEAQGEKKFRAAQIWEWLYRKRVQSFEEMTNLSKDLIAKLNDQFVVNPLKQRIVQESADGTVKYLFELPDGMLIETVLMRQHYGLSVCVTTQVGCNIGCTFCASGLIKKQRDLNNGEIVATPQDDSMATHTTKITKEMGQIDWSKPANEIANLIRGLNPAPGCYTYLDGKRLKVWSGEVVPSDTTHCLIDVHGKHVPIAISATTVPGTIVSKIAGLGVFCGDGNIILLTEVQPENKKRISAIDFINGHQIKEGIVFGDSI